jgi:hypothetical protein
MARLENRASDVREFPMLLQNPKTFFEAVRVELFDDVLVQEQVDGISAILDAWPEGTDPRWLAYALATACHETGRRMKPIAEWGRGQGKPYGIKTGPYQRVYYGRGLIQLTWFANYEKAEKEIPGSDLVRDPDNALKPAIAATILVKGMSDGWFTGRKLGDFFDEKRTDWLHAREIINGLDCAAEIAGYAVKFSHAIEAGTKAAASALATPSPQVAKPSIDLKPFAQAVDTALRAFQAAAGLAVDGDPGPDTRDALARALG